MPKKSDIRQRRTYAILAGEPDLVFHLKISSSEFLARLDRASRSDDNSHLLDLCKYGTMDYFLRRNMPLLLNPFQIGLFLRLYACTDGKEIAECRWRLHPNWDGIVRMLMFVAFVGASKYTMDHSGGISVYGSSLLAGVFCIIGFVGLFSSFVVHLGKLIDRNDFHDMDFLLLTIKDAAQLDDLSTPPMT